MIFETKRLILREYRESDLDSLYQIISDPVTMKYYKKPYSYEDSKRWINWNLNNYKEYGFGLWAIVLKETNEFIGDCGITMQKIDGNLLPEVGYHIDKKYHRIGLGYEACQVVMSWFFENTKYEDLYSYMTKENVGSYSLAIKNGMTKIKEYKDDDEDLLVYKITKDQWMKVNK